MTAVTDFALAARQNRIMTALTANCTVEEQTDWTSAPLPALIDHILNTHHTYMKVQLPRLTAMLETALQSVAPHDVATLLSIARVFAPMRAELDAHLAKEEIVLFPLVRRMVARESGDFHCKSVQNPIRVMLLEHDSAKDALEELRRLTNGFVSPKEADSTIRDLYRELAGLERDLHRHIYLENEVLFPRAIAIE